MKFHENYSLLAPFFTGSRYAMQNIKTILSTVIRQFRIYTEYKSIEEIRLKISIVLRMEDGMKLWLESR